MKFLFHISVALLVMAFVVPAAVAQKDGSLELTSAVLRQVEVQNEKGEKKIDLVPVQKALPGEELVVRITYTNRGSEPAENIVIVNPVPDQMIYVAGSASDGLVIPTFSIDGGMTFDLPEKLLVTDNSGNLVQASPKLYTHVRFTRTRVLPPGETDEVFFRAILE